MDLQLRKPASVKDPLHTYCVVLVHTLFGRLLCLSLSDVDERIRDVISLSLLLSLSRFFSGRFLSLHVDPFFLFDYRRRALFTFRFKQQAKEIIYISDHILGTSIISSLIVSNRLVVDEFLLRRSVVLCISNDVRRVIV